MIMMKPKLHRLQMSFQLEYSKVIVLLEEEMQKAADLKVELAVGTACGQDWYEAH